MHNNTKKSLNSVFLLSEFLSVHHNPINRFGTITHTLYASYARHCIYGSAARFLRRGPGRGYRDKEEGLGFRGSVETLKWSQKCGSMCIFSGKKFHSLYEDRRVCNSLDQCSVVYGLRTLCSNPEAPLRTPVEELGSPVSVTIAWT